MTNFWGPRIRRKAAEPEPERSIFKGGDVVRLKAGFRRMTVKRVVDFDATGGYIDPGVYCDWHDGLGRPCTAIYWDCELVKVDDETRR